MMIAGIDEVGRGPLAGPVVAACVVLPDGYVNAEIKDSKKLSAAQRKKLAPIIKEVALGWSIVSVGHDRIGKINIRNATKLAMKLASQKVPADLYRIDGNMKIDIDAEQETVVKGDNKHIEIAAASILAKVYRDELMQVLEKKYPGYGFAKHAGYPTKFHMESLLRLGPARVHRRGFAPVDRAYSLPNNHSD